jgi:outer membrane protein W
VTFVNDDCDELKRAAAFIVEGCIGVNRLEGIMRKSIVIAASLLFVVTSAFAQQPNHSNSVSVFVSDLSIFHSSTYGTRVDAGYGLSFDHMFSNRVSGELSVTSQRFRSFATIPGPADQPTTVSFSDRSYPIDANVSYHFLTDSRWKPYVGAGLRYVSDTLHSGGSFGVHEFTSRSVDPEVSGGVTFQFKPAFGLRFDAKQIIGSSNRSYGSDPDFKASVGLSFRF